MGTLGCGQHTVRIVDRCTGVSLAVPPLSRVDWERTQDAFSHATVQFAKRPGVDCCGDLGSVRTWRHRLEVLRDGVLVWCGPIVRTAENRTRFQVNALDDLAWLEKRVLRGARSFVEMEPTVILGAVITDALQHDPIPMQFAFTPTSATASLAWDETASTTGWAALRDTLDSQLMVSMVAGTLYAGATTVPDGPVAVLSDRDILSDLDVVEDGDGIATIAHVRGANGLSTIYPPDGATPAVDPFFGLVEGIFDRNTIDDADELKAAARSAWVGRRRPPLFVEMTSSTRLSPNAPITVEQLIPGAYVTLSITDERCRPVIGAYEITQVNVSQGSGSGSARTASGQFTTASDAAAEHVQIQLQPRMIDG